jgi:hypothetical protein
MRSSSSRVLSCITCIDNIMNTILRNISVRFILDEEVHKGRVVVVGCWWCQHIRDIQELSEQVPVTK